MTGGRRPGVPSGRSRIAVVAFGGNALVERGEDATQREQIRRAAQLAGRLRALVDAGWRCLLVHGNGPQVGDALLRVESAVHQVPPLPLDVCVAESQGSIGFLLETALRNALRGSRSPEPATLLTSVLVRATDPQLHRPTKPVGPYYPRYRALEIRRRRGWRMVHEPGRGYRRVVPSPRPVEIVGLEALRGLLRDSRLVIAGGGGGIPVVRTTAGLRGVEAVIDKDLTAMLLARRLRAALFVILTDVEGVYEQWGRSGQALLPRLTVARARAGLRRGEYPPGSMGPKVAAAAAFASATGRPVLITSAAHLADGLAGRTGTLVVRGGGRS